MVRAYLLVETAANHPSWTDDHDGAIGFAMCKGLYHSLWNNEVVLHLECEDEESLSQVITRDVPKLRGVSRVTTCVISKT